MLQAGLSWATILAKRQAYRTAFEGFDPRKVAAFDDSKVQQLLAPESGVVRHKGKLQGAVTNAK
jgi:DNA-3-methyladenine glycosylase I